MREMPDVVSVILRALSFVLLFQAAGVAIFVAVFGRRLASSQVSVRRLGQAAAIAGIVLVAAHYALEAARMAGEMSGMWDPTLQGMAWNSPAGTALICRLLGLLLFAVGLQEARVGCCMSRACGRRAPGLRTSSNCSPPLRLGSCRCSSWPELSWPFCCFRT